MERPPPPNLRLDASILAIRAELFGPATIPSYAGSAPIHPSVPRGGTDVKYNYSVFAGLSHLFNV